MDEIELSKKELEQTEEEYNRSFIDFRIALAEAVRRKEQELIDVQADMRQVQNKLQERNLELELANEKLRKAEALLLSRKKETTNNKVAIRFQGLLTSILFLLATVLASFGINLLTSTSSSSLGWIMLTLATITYVTTAVISVLIDLENGNIFSNIGTSLFQRKLPPRWILRSYKYINTESFYEIDENNPSHHIFTITTTIQATQSGVNIFENTYRWTGQGKEGTIKVLSPEHKFLGEVRHNNGWNYYYIHLGRPLNVGERTEIITQQELYDTENSFEPYLAKIISEPVDNLILHVKLPLNLLPSKITYTIWNTEGPASKAIHVTTGEVNTRTGEIIWEVMKPTLGFRYEIRWSYYNDSSL